MKAKKLLSVLLAVCMVLSVLPMALFTAGAEYEALTDYLTVACTANTNGGSNRDATNDYGSHGVNNEANNISTVNGSVAVYSIDFGEDTYSSIQIHYSGRTSGRCPTSANANIYLGDYWTDPEGCTLLGNVKLPPYGSENWDSRNLSTIAAFDGLTGTQTISVQYIGEDGYSTVSNARQMYFYKEALADLTSYVDAENATVSTASASKTGVGGGEGPARLFAGLGNKMGINFKEGETPTLTYVTTVPTTVYAYTYMTANDSAERDPKSWNFYGSSDGETWTLIDAVTDFSAPSTRCCWSDVLFKVDSPAEYSYYKLEITACKNITSGYCQLDEWRTYGTLYSGADAIEEVEALISAIAETEPLSDEYFAAIAAAEAAYDKLGEANQGYVTNSAALTEPSAVAKAKADGKDYTYIYNTIEQIKGFMPISYKSKTSLDLIESLYTDAVAKLGEADVKAYIVNYADAMNAKATYRKIIDDFSVTFTLSKDRMTTNNQKWLANQTDEEWNSTLAAMADTVKYFYAERMINIGIASGTTRSTENHDYVLGAQLESKPNDNCVSPWSSSRYWSYLIVPFSGMAFDVGGYMVINDNHKQAPLGEEFDLAADGRTYQVMWNKTISHVTTPRQNGKSITVDSVSVYPGSGDYASVIGNVFRYMYANYAQTNKWDGKTLGYPTADARLAGTATYYQNFLSDDGNAVLLSTADILGGVALAVDAEGYEAQLKSAAGSGFVLTGEMMDVIDSKGGAAAFFSSTGDLDVENSTADRLVFEKGTLTTAGFESTLSEDELKAMAAPVISLIDAIGEVTTLGPSGNKLAAIEAAEKAYDELLIDAREYVTNYTVLCDARAAYDALTDTQKELVKNYEKLLAAEELYEELTASAAAIAQKAAEEARKAQEEAEAAQKAAEEAVEAAKAAQEAAEAAAAKAGENNAAAEEARKAAETAQAAAEAAQAKAEEAQKKAEEAKTGAEAARKAAEENNAAAAAEAAKAVAEAVKAAEEAGRSAQSAAQAAQSAAQAADSMLKAQEAQAAAEAAQAAAEAAKARAEEAQKKAEEAAASSAEDKEAAERAKVEAEAAKKAAEDAQKAAEDAKAAAELALEAAKKSEVEAAASAAEAAEYARQMAETYQKVVEIKAELIDYLAEAQAAAEKAEAERKAAEEARKAAEEAALAASKYAASFELAQLLHESETLTGHAREDYAKVIEDAKAAIEAAKTPEEVDEILAAAREALKTAGCPSTNFTDVEENGWYHTGVDFMVKNGFMNGVADDAFDVDGNLTRAQLVTILYRIAGEPESTATNPFADVADGQWYTNAVIWAAENGIVKGVNTTTFAPNDQITREQIATILFRYAKAEKVEGKLAGFPDAEKVSDYAADAMAWAVEQGLINGISESDGKTYLAPQETATRAQIAVILMRYLTAEN